MHLADSGELVRILDETEQESEIYWKYGESYGYVFYVFRAAEREERRRGVASSEIPLPPGSTITVSGLASGSALIANRRIVESGAALRRTSAGNLSGSDLRHWENKRNAVVAQSIVYR